MSEVGDSAGQGSRHAFGGAWTLIKLEVIKKYLNAYTTALKNKGYRLIYIDGFAGSGSIDIWTGLAEDDGRYDGSAKIAIANTPPFTDLIFIEKQHQRVKELRELAAVHANRRIEIRRGDANGELASLCDSYSWRESRAVLFLDPYGLAVEWATLQRIAATKAIDVWYLFPLAGLYRQLAMDSRAIDDAKAKSITLCLGTDQWRSEFYSPGRTEDMFDGPVHHRHAKWPQISDFVTSRLTNVFVKVVGPKLLFLERHDEDGPSSTGTPLFALYFAVSNPNPKAVELACRMARDILK